MTEPMQ